MVNQSDTSTAQKGLGLGKCLLHPVKSLMDNVYVDQIIRPKVGCPSSLHYFCFGGLIDHPLVFLSRYGEQHVLVRCYIL